MKRNVLYVIVIVALCLVGISACSSPTAPGPTPGISLAIVPSTQTVPVNGTTNFVVSDTTSVCTATRGKVTQSGTNLTYVAPASNGLDEIRCEKTGAQPGVAMVTVSRQVVIQYSRPDGMVFGSPETDNVTIRMYSQNQFGWSEQNCPTTLVQSAPKKVWQCLRDFGPGTYHTSVGDSKRISGGRVADDVTVWGVLIKSFMTIPELNGIMAKFEITADYNVR